MQKQPWLLIITSLRILFSIGRFWAAPFGKKVLESKREKKKHTKKCHQFKSPSHTNTPLAESGISYKICWQSSFPAGCVAILCVFECEQWNKLQNTLLFSYLLLCLSFSSALLLCVFFIIIILDAAHFKLLLGMDYFIFCNFSNKKMDAFIYLSWLRVSLEADLKFYS